MKKEPLEDVDRGLMGPRELIKIIILTFCRTHANVTLGYGGDNDGYWLVY